MPDRYGDDDEPVVDFDSRRQARLTANAIEAAQEQRRRLAESRAVHQPMSAEQARAARDYQRQVVDNAEAARRAIRIANCPLCDDTGYVQGTATVCDHKDHRPARDRGIALVKQTMGWDDPTDPRNVTDLDAPGPATGQTPGVEPSSTPDGPEGASEPPAGGPW